MSTRSVVETVFNLTAMRADPDEIASHFSEQVDWLIAGDEETVPWIGRRHGRAGVAQFHRQLRALTESERFNAASVVVDGDRAIVLGELATRVLATGRLIETEFAFDIRVTGGLIDRFHVLEDTFAVRQAAVEERGDRAAQNQSRIDIIRSYFLRVNAGEDYLDLFTDDLRFYFPKFGHGTGKQALKTFGERMGKLLTNIQHDIESFQYILAGDAIVVEGTERGTTRDGVQWPDGTISQGRFCSVFEFSGVLIRRMHIYVDPDFTSADQPRIALLSGE